MKRWFATVAVAMGLNVGLGAVTTADSADMLVEIYRIAPGQHANFLKVIALYDQASKEAGLAPRQLYVHQDGASWDFLIIQPANVTPEQGKALNAALKRLGAPQGAKFFLEIRSYMAEHSDTFVEGPTTAADWLNKLNPQPTTP